MVIWDGVVNRDTFVFLKVVALSAKVHRHFIPRASLCVQRRKRLSRVRVVCERGLCSFRQC